MYLMNLMYLFYELGGMEKIFHVVFWYLAGFRSFMPIFLFFKCLILGSLMYITYTGH